MHCACTLLVPTSSTREDFDRDWMPAFCVGFLSLTSPAIGAQLAQVRDNRF